MSSETEIRNNTINIVIGTMDRKNPNSIYIDLNGYITPNLNKNDYAQELKTLDASISSAVNSIIKEKDDIFEKNSICIFDVAGKRMSYDKKSYFSIQIFLKLKNEFVEKNQSSFTKITKTDELRQFVDDESLSVLFEKYGFMVSKTKS
jgi:hypothetical protein